MNAAVRHPLQSKEWVEFRIKSGVPVREISPDFFMSLHPVQLTNRTIGYLPKSLLPDSQVWKKLVLMGIKNRCIFIKIEPNILRGENNTIKVNIPTSVEVDGKKYQIKQSPHPLFTKYSFQLDLTKTEQELLQNMKQKTRYNIKVAEKNGVEIKEESSPEAFNTYLRLSQKTWKRQKFFAHGETYHRNMWQILHKAGIARLFIAYYKPDLHSGNTQPVPLTAWIVFLKDGILYYPYGASSEEYKSVMASTKMMWEVIKWGKHNGAKLFDMWGAMGPEPNTKDPWYGFHRFKEGFGPKHVEFVGSFDLILNPILYTIYSMVYPLRSTLLKLFR